MTQTPIPLDDPRPTPPELPGPNEHCESGCDLCVHDLHAQALAGYRRELAQWLERHPGGPTPC
ncbi:MAG: oxidoreductase-like domain-containing protein [Acidovorax sp.]|uniref:oxidoreductase-like domain-containing protein n=1 Tax=Acidovorax sp. TaxID=1872122 RepID=UPI0039E4B0A5